MFSLFLQLALFYGLLTHAQPPPQLGYIPLAVKTPYFHAWINNDGAQSPANIWSQFVLAGRHNSWAGIVRVDNQTYEWMGNTGGFNYTRTVMSEITPSKTIFRIEAGPIQFNVTFLSPLEPTDYVRQSVPFSYLYIDGITANDSQPHTVQVYSDVTAEWVSKEDGTLVVWNTTDKNDMIYHRMERQSPSPMVENGGIAEDATGYYATTKRSGLTWQTDGSIDCRVTFATHGTLKNSSDTNFRAISDDFPVFAFSVDLGIISPGDQLDPVVSTLGLVRDPLVTYTAGGVTQSRSAYYWLNYTSVEEVISAFLSDSTDARNRSMDLDNKVLSAASAISPEYAGVLSLVTRQIFASMDITIPSAEPGQFNGSDVKVFMKDVGQSQRTNPVEVIYGALPALLFFNPSLARDLLQPLLEFQLSPQYPNPYAAPDLGTSYPLVQGNSTDAHTLAVENNGNMLIMVYAHAVKSGDGTLLSHYYSVFQRWADFLVDNSLHPSGFITADGFNNPDMSNLALKGILGVYSMAKINEALGLSSTTYMDRAMQLIQQWKHLAVASDGHIQAVYGQTNSWGLMYNLFPAIWLGTGLIENSVLELQAQFYAQQSSLGFGVNLDSSRPDTAYPHWTLMTAATVPNSLSAVRDGLINSTYQRAFMPNTSSTLPVVYKPSDGSPLSGAGSPVLGAFFAVVAMGIQNANISAPQASIGGSHHQKGNVGTIVGGVLGGFAVLLGTLVTFLFYRKHLQQKRAAVAAYRAFPFIPAEQNNTESGGQMAKVPHQASQGDKWVLDSLRFSQTHSTREMGGTPTLLVPAVPPPVMSRKQREALGRSRRSPSLQSESAGVPLFSRSNPISVSGADDLRTELERLRREVDSLRHMSDAPPGYA